VKELWLFTRQFPTGSGEVFLENALPVWAARFHRIRVFPMFTGTGRAALPEGVEVRTLWTDPYARPGAWATLQELALLVRILKERGGSISTVVPWRPSVLAHARQSVERLQAMETFFRAHYDPERVVLLSVWMEDWATLLGLMGERGFPLHYTTMAHRTDLFGSGDRWGRVPFQRFQMCQADRVLCIAQDGLDTLRARHPGLAEKLDLVRLGSRDHGAGPWSPGPELRLVSCSYTNPRKRVERIAESLALVRRPVSWTHFGDGPSQGLVRSLAEKLPAHIRVQLRGDTTNSEVLKAYASEPFDLFVHLSAHEGVPVALMEAASFGIPLLATDAGGVREIVDARSGHLLPVDTSPAEVAHWLDGPACQVLLTGGFRAGVRAAWKERFEATSGYDRIADILLREQRSDPTR
jgi:glycosyltransferase involved in cell wall biosynthesis